jgi:hypothetical protein
LALPSSGWGLRFLRVLGMWLNFVISAALITFFVQRFAQTLRARERELSRKREEALARAAIEVEAQKAFPRAGGGPAQRTHRCPGHAGGGHRP